jgi:hypothetical protein
MARDRDPGGGRRRGLGDSAVKAKFTVVSPTKITATVPSGAKTVAVTVTTPFGTSAAQFTYTA